MTEETISPTRRTRAMQADAQDTDSLPAKSGRKMTKKKITLAIAALVILAIAAVAIYSSYELYKIKNPAYQQKLLQEQVQKISNRVGRLIQLPDGTPQIATVSDAASLKQSQPFFASAINGDQVLVYSTEAILYRPSTNKIINVGPVTSDQKPATVVPTVSSTTAATASTAVLPAKVAGKK